MRKSIEWKGKKKRKKIRKNTDWTGKKEKKRKKVRKKESKIKFE